MSIHPVSLAQKAKVLADALPHIRHLHGKTLVIGLGGDAMAEPGLRAAFGRDITMLRLVGMNPVVVHGGGPRIDDLLAKLGSTSEFPSGVHVTEDDSIALVEMVLGKLNREIVGVINQQGGKAIGLSGQDGHFIRARKMVPPPQGGGRIARGIGPVGEIAGIDPEILNLHCTRGFIPVVMPIGIGTEGEAYNIDPDRVAGKLAEILAAEKLLLMANAPGILDKSGQPIGSVNCAEIDGLLADGGIQADVPRNIAAALEAVKCGVKAAHVIDARVPNALLLELLSSEGMGTTILSRRTRLSASDQRPGSIGKASG